MSFSKTLLNFLLRVRFLMAHSNKKFKPAFLSYYHYNPQYHAEFKFFNQKKNNLNDKMHVQKMK